MRTQTGSDVLSERSGTGRITYPFSSGISIAVENGASLSDLFAGGGQEFATVHVHQREPRGEKIDARPVLELVSKINRRILPGGSPGNEVMSWLLGRRVIQAMQRTDATIGEVAQAQEKDLQVELGKLLKMKTIEPMLEHRMLNSFLAGFVDSARGFARQGPLAGLLLRLPWLALRTSSGQTIATLLRDEALARAGQGNQAARGYALEVAVACDHLLQTPAPRDRFLFRGATALGKDGQPAQEWDVVVIDLLPAGGWQLTAVECAVKRSKAKDKEGREKLDLLREALTTRFSDLEAYATYFATVANGELEYEDAGRSWQTVK
jgi:hypothetical protein